MKCESCGASLEPTASGCPACGAEVELGRLTGILGIVCRSCDAYNEPRARTCAACGKPLGSPEEPEAHPPAPSAVPSGTPAAAPPQSPPPAVAPPGAPVVRAFARPSTGAATRFVPSVLRPSAPQRPPEQPALTPIPLASTCPRCGADAGPGLFCSRCGQALGARGTQVMPKPAAAGRTATPGIEPLTPGRVKLVLEAGGGPSGASWRLSSETVDAGRSSGVVVFPDDPCLAPHHATFHFRGGALHVRDEGAPGGVFLRLRGTSVPIRAGDHFAVGERLLRYAGLVPPAPLPPPDGTRRLGAPRPPAPAIVVEEWLEGGRSGRVFVRGGPSVTIGRAGCAVNLGDDPHLSQAHAEILVDASGAARLKDLGSSSGTYAKIPPHGERELRDGDRLRMGRQVLRIEVVR